MTYRDVISSIRTNLRLTNLDNMIPDRAILSEVKSVANLIVGQSLSKRKYWQSPNLFSFVPCFKMSQVPLHECCEYTGDAKVALSDLALPRIGEGVFGLAIQGIFGIDGKIKFNETNPNRYANLLKLKKHGLDRYFWIRNDGRLVVTNEDTKRIHGYFYFTELLPNSLLFPGSDCECKQKPDVEDLCANPLDQRFPFISERLDDLKRLVYQNLLQTYYKVPADKQSDQVDGQAQ